MGRRKLSDKNIRKLQHSNGTYYLTVPIEIVREMKLKEREKVIFSFDKRTKTIKIKDWKE